MKLLPKFKCELESSIGHDLLGYSMKTYCLGHVQLEKLSSKICHLDRDEMSNLGQSIHDYPYGVVPCLSTGQSNFVIFNGCNNLVGLWCSSLTRWHVSHNDTYSAISLFMSYHQYLVLDPYTSWYCRDELNTLSHELPEELAPE
jgi:hypothetical protein